MKKLSTLSQITAIHTLLSKQGLKDEKRNIVLSFTAGRTDSVKEMKNDEAAALIGHLKSMDPEEKSAEKMRNKIISMAHEMGWHLAGTTKIDMNHLNGWMRSKSYLKKDLDAYRYAELPKLVSQFEEVYKSYLNKV